jgi:hypothetical protein
MAKVIDRSIDSELVSPFYPFLRIVIVGIATGMVFWAATEVINNYANSISLSSNLATIISAIIAVIIMVRLQIAQPLIIAVISGAALWGLAEWTDGLVWGEALAWSALLYALAYVLFSWLLRFKRTLPILIGAVIILIAIRVVITL